MGAIVLNASQERGAVAASAERIELSAPHSSQFKCCLLLAVQCTYLWGSAICVALCNSHTSEYEQRAETAPALGRRGRHAEGALSCIPAVDTLDAHPRLPACLFYLLQIHRPY